MISYMDNDIGKIMARVKKLGLDDNTIIIFTSDNGPTYNRLGGSDSDYFKSAGPFRGLKGSTYEGGIRVPMVARWPGHIKPGTESDLISAFWDFMPTFAEVIGANTPNDVDGYSLLPTLTGKGEQKKHDYLYWEFHGYGKQQAVRLGDWKAYRMNIGKGNRTLELYNLKTDISEKNDVAAENPELIKKIEKIMKEAHSPLQTR